MIRSFTSADEAAVRELVLAGLKERWGSAFDPAYNPDLDDLQASYLERGGEIVVIEDDGRLIATGTLIPEGGQRGRIVRMSVAGSRRRSGLGRQVVGELLRRARARGMTEVVVSTDTPWASALALYRSCGFVETSWDDAHTHYVIAL